MSIVAFKFTLKSDVIFKVLIFCPLLSGVVELTALNISLCEVAEHLAKLQFTFMLFLKVHFFELVELILSLIFPLGALDEFMDFVEPSCM